MFTSKAEKDPRISTGISGLDDILDNGIPSNRLYLIHGDPGTGKTTLGLQFLREGVAQGEKTLYVTLSETKAELQQVAHSHNWSLDGIALYELETIQDRLQPDEQYTLFHPAEVELGEITQRIYAEVEKLQPSRVVFDSLSEMRLLARDPLRYRRQILALKQFFVGRQCTVFLLDDRTSNDSNNQLESICHGVFLLETLMTDHGSTPRRFRIIKLRGVQFQEGYHDLVIEKGGVKIYPRLIAHDERMPESMPLSRTLRSGIPSLDALLGEGLNYGSSVLVLGPAGCGKSSLATQYLWQALKQGERVACYLFEEGRESYLKRSAGLGIPLEPFIAKDLLNLHQIDAARLTPGEFAMRVREEVEMRKTRIVVIDSLNGYLNAMPSNRYLLIQMHELLTYLNDHGVLTFLTLAQHGMVGTMQTPVDVSYLADTVILMRYFEARGAIHKAISVMKKRMGAHEDTIREFRLTSAGLQLGEPLTEFRGVLTGTPVYPEKALPAMER